MYSNIVCPYNYNACGLERDFDLNKGFVQVNITNLQAGQVCAYRLTSSAGAPSFKPVQIHLEQDFEI